MTRSKAWAGVLAAALAVASPRMVRAAGAEGTPLSSAMPAPPSAPPPASLFLETDPAMFVLGGFAAHVRVRALAAPHWSFGGGAYALTLPGFMVDLDSANRGTGWTSRIAFAAGVFVDRYFREDGEGVFVGAQLGGQAFRVTRTDAAPGEATFTNLLVMPRVGYTWRPFHAGFYVMPWLGVRGTTRVGGDTSVAGKRYDVYPVVAFATVHVGWAF
jgi:hypothetical protein